MAQRWDAQFPRDSSFAVRENPPSRQQCSSLGLTCALLQLPGHQLHPWGSPKPRGALKLSSIWGSCSPTDSSFSSLPQACQILGNYSSLRAILAALQSASIHRLQRTWDNVSRKSFRTFQKLCREDNPQGRELLIKTRPSNKLASLVRQLQRARKGLPKKGVVPYLGTFLCDLVVLDTAMEDYLEGNEINHRKKNKVSIRSPGCREGQATPIRDAPGKNIAWLHPLPSISHFLGQVAKNEVQDPSSQSVGIQKGIKENFP
ncbi:ral guanine nucleotide dissociation stimulator-like 1 isoform X1 [Mustela putorius furo]|uniref:Ral guanine nucleotide dissociation stimulator-like 1 isoform X1 n=1 Tax=Mustela putorius furo TaxID=9669 RepID=A0A8U0S765_MUSPF|nr:ral guanine nucleotide dissociation stimulator-like 1 isoform X1 [Mustela putorius furo]XP_044937731.1 ral guanine nucleotide dissociation stimulator-like 1 isoform X1 [Mustela putorius furo]XP_044937732.1 ral guanine nucleotide dissociation stimulator-like 1 isoform X1 [Mustela putorius furo]XP_044937733.1 ral guanine nucleotide dissociation stimulator-like 1 isoform X1 [Mustela putorius furo]